MTFTAFLVWALIVAGTAFMLKTLIFKKGQGQEQGCCMEANAGATAGAATETAPETEAAVEKEAAVEEAPEEKGEVAEEQKPAGEESEK